MWDPLFFSFSLSLSRSPPPPLLTLVTSKVIYVCACSGFCFCTVLLCGLVPPRGEIYYCGQARAFVSNKHKQRAFYTLTTLNMLTLSCREFGLWMPYDASNVNWLKINTPLLLESEGKKKGLCAFVTWSYCSLSIGIPLIKPDEKVKLVHLKWFSG